MERALGKCGKRDGWSEKGEYKGNVKIWRKEQAHQHTHTHTYSHFPTEVNVSNKKELKLKKRKEFTHKLIFSVSHSYGPKERKKCSLIYQGQLHCPEQIARCSSEQLSM